MNGALGEFEKSEMNSSGSCDFLGISKEIYKRHADHEKNIKQHCVKSSMIPLTDFYAEFERELKEINSEITPSKDCPDIADFADIFKSFEEYPAILQKPKRASTKDLSRMNTSALRDVTKLNSLKESANSTQNVAKTEDKQSASETYSGFKKFQQKLNQILKELQQKQLATNYEAKLCQVNAFAKELEKLMPSTKVCKEIFSGAEEAQLQSLLANLEELNCILRNQDLLYNIEDNLHSSRMDSFVEIITYLLSSLAMI